MQYLYAEKQNFEDLSSGRVIYQKAGAATFPVRLANEIFLRCFNHLQPKGRIVVFDPMCGQGYLLTVLGAQFGKKIRSLIGADIDQEVLKVAEKNVGLLTSVGLHKRKEEIQQLYHQFGKPSHQEALQSVEKWEKWIAPAMETQLRCQDVFQPNYPLTEKADLIMTDVPYGQLANWQHAHAEPMEKLLDSLGESLKPGGIVAIISDKQQKMKPSGWMRLEKEKIGKRKFEMFRRA
ncbi:MAG: hypothetical protein AAF206_00205 [Bacteroidota bacterium]